MLFLKFEYLMIYERYLYLLKFYSNYSSKVLATKKRKIVKMTFHRLKIIIYGRRKRENSFSHNLRLLLLCVNQFTYGREYMPLHMTHKQTSIMAKFMKWPT